MLIELLEERSSLWDISNNDHWKHNVNDTTYNEIADDCGCNITSIKRKKTMD